jgi:hypothetical protein
MSAIGSGLQVIMESLVVIFLLMSVVEIIIFRRYLKYRRGRRPIREGFIWGTILFNLIYLPLVIVMLKLFFSAINFL